MSEGRVPSPDFDSSRYERPNKKWVCGHARDGCPCRIGPSPQGTCRATTECAPKLVLRPGEAKGTWVCTRPAEWGGKCAAGPLPDGTCCRAIIPCIPQRSLRERRGLLASAVVAACVGVVLVGLSGSSRASFINPRALSRQHSGAEFAHLAAHAADRKGCVLCHVDADAGFADLLVAAMATSGTSLRPSVLVSSHPSDFSRMDRSCIACHAAQSFHEPNVAINAACSVCHREHMGAGPMAAVDTQNCTDCHGDAAQMRAARDLGRPMPAVLFSRMVPAGLVVREGTRPPEGYTAVITSFADHPEFRVLRDHVPDPDTLKFNHRLHLSRSTIPLVNGQALACVSCHRPDASGAYMARISFEQDCRPCHALSFDEATPGMSLPHGDAAFVRAYLRSLPVQYADYASQKLGISAKGAVDAYVRHAVRALRERVHTGEDLEREVFLSDGRTVPSAGVLGAGATRARFAGCALCHEVAWRENAVPVVTAPLIPDRWLPGARFNHASHATMSCAECHAAAASERSSDVVLPTQQSCVRCHSPKGGAADSCMTCHLYHNRPPAAPMEAETASVR